MKLERKIRDLSMVNNSVVFFSPVRLVVFCKPINYERFTSEAKTNSKKPGTSLLCQVPVVTRSTTTDFDMFQWPFQENHC